MNMLRDMITGNNQELALANLTDIDETINDTAVDVFIYDTSKDSDGGAWRHRTQHTSWYAEASSANRDPNTRSTRAEFPAVAVIVAESDKVTIYDGDDPSLPMWRVTNRVGGIFGFWRNISNVAATAVSAKNGKVVFGINLGSENASGGCAVADYAADKLSRYSTINGGGTGLTVTQDATSGLEFPLFFGASGPLIVSGAVNDVAMTVLPDAPTDPATGIAVPTIYVFTDGGVSRIADDGTVSSTAGTPAAAKGGIFDNRVWTVSVIGSQSYFGSLPLSETLPAGGLANVAYYWRSGKTTTYDYYTAPNVNVTEANIADDAFGVSKGLHSFDYNEADNSASMVAYTTSSYTTGWMNGDIKLAALADSTAETLGDAASGATVSDPNGDGVYDGEHVTNGGFDNDSDWTKAANWTISGGQADAVNTSNGDIYQTITTVVGKTYVLSCDIPSTFSGITAVLQIRNSANTATIKDTSLLGVSTSASLTFVATSTVHFVRVYTAVASGSIDNISVKLADSDRSVNGNGLGVHGSITKAPVATGADVVAYSGFSNSNYLEQPYNSDLDFGTGDFCVMGWAEGKRANFNCFLHRTSIKTTAAGLRFMDNGSGQILVTGYGSTLEGGVYPANDWFHVCFVRKDDVGYIYLNGTLANSGAWAASVTDADATLALGGYWFNNALLANSPPLALWRISGTAPTADQIKKIYEDERPLFQPNAKATLTGTSDAVTALAHDPDTNLLHVGTSGGRSVFQGLRRVEEHTGTNSQSLAAISAVDGLVVEGK